MLRTQVYSDRRVELRTTLRALLRRAEYVFAFLALSAFAGSISVLLGRLGLTGEGGVADSPKEIFLPPIYLISAGVLLLRPSRLLRAAARNKPTLVLTGLALVSWFWSAAPMLTLKRSTMLIALTLFALYLVTRFSQRELLHLLGWVLGTIAVLSTVYALIYPDRGITSGLHQGSWTGIYSEKNGFGRYMALGALVFAAIAMQQKRTRYAWVGAGFCALLVVLSRSTTALVAMACALAVVAVMPALRQRGLLFISSAILILVLVVNSGLLLVANLDVAARALGKDPSFTGRIPLWGSLIADIAVKPWLGSGYDAFWVNESGAPGALQFEVTGGWDVWHAHNGFLNLALELGVVGVSLFLIGYLVAFGRAVRRLRCSSVGTGFWEVALLVFLLATSVSESMLLQYNSLWWVAYLVTVFAPVPSLSRAPHGSRLNAGSRMVRKPVSAAAPGSTMVQVRQSRISPGIRWLIRSGRSQRL